MSIRLLDEQLINQIAAGEVIERPASVVKELVDNALDSRASIIKVRFTQGGTEEVEVEDNGGGIEPTELPIAFQRHATSKIACEADLSRIHTMGFRGEALPSIASVSRMEVFTCTHDKPGMYALYEGGKAKEMRAEPCPPGTRVIVHDLFYNTPARRKFLKSTVSEGNQIHDLVCKYALARPEVSFSLISGKKSYFKTPGNGSLRDAALAVYGLEYISSLLEVEYEGASLQLKGLISPPERSRKNRRHQLFFINQRPIRSSLLYRAVDTAYQGLLVSREHPLIILNLLVPSDQVDVNVHPQKWEVRFADEQQIFNMVRHVLAERISRHDISPAQGIKMPASTYIPSPSYRGTSVQESHRSLWNHADKQTEVIYAQPPETISRYSDSMIKVLGQVLQTYVLIEKDDGLWIIDQHAAYERITYNRIRAQYQEGLAGSPLLFPETIHLNTRQIDLLMDEEPSLLDLGFVLDRVGPDSAIIRSAPDQLKGREKEVILDLLEMLEGSGINDFRDEAMKTMACRKSAKAGDFLSPAEMESLVMELFEQDQYQHCPHGRPTLMKMGRSDLEKMFKRA